MKIGKYTINNGGIKYFFSWTVIKGTVLVITLAHSQPAKDADPQARVFAKYLF